MKNKKLFFLLMINIVVFVLIGCSSNGVEKVKLNASLSKEYNNVIKLYNRSAIAFTDLAKLVDKEINKPSGFDDEFWEKYDKKEEKLLDQKKNLENCSSTYEVIEKFEEELDPFTKDLGKYLEAVTILRKDSSNRSKEEFRVIHKKLYDQMMAQSIQLVKSLDRIHDEELLSK